ncbi:MAG: iron-containing redox enzyme family protein [Nitrospinae bacterium]|nr:iron-containing redox enzyme family protein [Nitrospinota bacterium]
MTEIIWTDEAKKRLERVPQGFMRSMSQSRIESFALDKGINLITLEVAEDAIGEARKIMGGMPVLKSFNSGMGAMNAPPLYRCKLCGYTAEGLPESCPVCGAGRDRFELVDKAEAKVNLTSELKWTQEAAERLKKIPEGFMRDMTKWRIEKTARDKGLSAVTLDVMQEKYDYWGQGSAKVHKTFPWTKEADEKVERIPPFVRGMVIKEIESLTEKKGLKEVTPDLIEESKKMWKGTMEFHSDLEGKEEKSGKDFLQQLKDEIFSHEAVNHPFLERFSKGNLSEEQVKTFAVHYYQHAKMFSHYIANIIPKIPHEQDRMLMVKNLMDEYGNLSPEKTHPALFRKFLTGLGLEKKDWKKFKPIPEVTNFIDRLTMLTRYEPFLIGFGAVGPGVEWVIPTMFKKIVDGLKRSISMKEDDMEYWTSHIILDAEHGEAATTILRNYLHDGESHYMVRKGAMKSLEARKILWDGFGRLLDFT